MPDFIFDDQGIQPIATIVDGEVRNMEGKKVARVEGLNILGLDGELIGHLQGDCVRKSGGSTPPQFLDLLK
jgi:hypothetical protein